MAARHQDCGGREQSHAPLRALRGGDAVVTLEIITAGLQTSMVAAPFRGLRHQAMPMAGAADPLSHAIANRIVGRAAESAALEITLGRAVFRAGMAMEAAVVGAVNQILLNGKSQPVGQPVDLAAGDVIEIGNSVAGMRSYLALSPEFDVVERLGSYGTYIPGGFGGFQGRVLRDGDIIYLRKTTSPPRRRGPMAAWRQVYSGREQSHAPLRAPRGGDGLGLLLPRFTSETILRYTAGPESHPASDSQLSCTRWRVSNRMDRMGIALDGPALTPQHTAQLPSSAVFPGTIQCPPGGQPFLLGIDGQTTGGYPRIAQIIRADRHLIGQLRPHSHVRLVRIDIATAHAIYRQKLNLWRQYIPDLRLD